jgi:hypothetical protein
MNVKESLFENEFNLTEKLAKEYTRVMLRKNMIGYFIFGGLFILSYIWLRSILLVIMGILAPTLGPFSLSMIGRKVWKQWKTLYHMLGDTENLKTKKQFFEDEVITTNSLNNDFTLCYKQISYMVETKKYLYISFEKVFECIVKKDSFTKGDYETFVTFLRERLAENPKALRGLRSK